MSKIYGYCRTAQDNEEAIQKQKQEIFDYCNKVGFKIDKFLYESGGGMVLHTQLKEAINNLNNGDIIIVSERSRIARDYFLVKTVEDIIVSCGAKLVIINEIGVDINAIESVLSKIIESYTNRKVVM